MATKNRAARLGLFLSGGFLATLILIVIAMVEPSFESLLFLLSLTVKGQDGHATWFLRSKGSGRENRMDHVQSTNKQMLSWSKYSNLLESWDLY